MFARRNNQRWVSILAMLTLSLSILASPFAQARAMRFAAVGMDLCKSPAGSTSQPAMPVEHRHASHGAGCECCTGSAPDAATIAVALAMILRVDTTFVAPIAATFVPLAFHIERAAQPRAPPILA